MIRQAYQLLGASGWEEVLQGIRGEVNCRMVGDWLQNQNNQTNKGYFPKTARAVTRMGGGGGGEIPGVPVTPPF